MLDEQLGLLGREHARQALGQARQRHDRARVQRPRADAAAVAQERARGRQAPAARGGRQPGALERARERLEVVGGGVVDLDVALRAGTRCSCVEVAAVGGDGVARGAALERQVREEVRDRDPRRTLRAPSPVPSQRCRSLHEHPRRREPHRAGRRRRLARRRAARDPGLARRAHALAVHAGAGHGAAARGRARRDRRRLRRRLRDRRAAAARRRARERLGHRSGGDRRHARERRGATPIRRA